MYVMYAFRSLMKMLEIKLASGNKVAALSTSERHVWELHCVLHWQGWNEIQAGRWSHQKHQHDHLLKRTSDRSISWGCWWETGQEGWPSAVRHSSRTVLLAQAQRCLALDMEKLSQETLVLMFTRPLRSFILHMISLFVLQNVFYVYKE